jgi:hypothetical protein
MHTSRTNILCILSVLVLSGSCIKPSPVWSTYNVPTTYNFYNVYDSNQLVLLAMTDQITAKMNQAGVSGTVVSAQVLKDMFENQNGYFNDSTLHLNNSGLRLSDYCAVAAQTDLMNYFDSIGVYSQSTGAASAGVAGVAGGYLLSPNGVCYSEVVQKTIMTGVLNYTIDVYLADSIGDAVDNTNITPGIGTRMEHVWDEAFGLFGVPKDFPMDTLHLKYLGYYSNLVDTALQSNATLMTAFITGRAAITSNDMGTKQTQATLVMTSLEQLQAASLVHELNAADRYIQAGNLPAAHAVLSGALGFLRGLQYNNSPARIITNTQVTQTLALFDTFNLYTFAATDAVRQAIGGVYGFSASQLAAF